MAQGKTRFGHYEAATVHSCGDDIERADPSVPLMGSSDDGCSVAGGNDRDAGRAEFEADEVGQEINEERSAAVGEDHGAGRPEPRNAACGPQGCGESDCDDGFAAKKENEGILVIRWAEVEYLVD